VVSEIDEFIPVESIFTNKRGVVIHYYDFLMFTNSNLQLGFRSSLKLTKLLPASPNTLFLYKKDNIY